jgi:hypothetical protein
MKFGILGTPWKFLFGSAKLAPAGLFIVAAETGGDGLTTAWHPNRTYSNGQI